MGKLIIKIGSSTLVDESRHINREWLSSLADQVNAARLSGWQVIIVSSGAIACGLRALGIEKRPNDLPSLQAAASVGQSAFAAAYSSAFQPFGVLTSSVLLTRRDTADRNAYLHARDTLNRLLELGVVPIVNENDTVSVEQIKFGDNDTLAALVSCLVEAQKCIIISDIDGLYTENPAKNPEARLIKKVETITPEIMSNAGDAGSAVGSGGMITKLKAARVLMAAGVPMHIVAGSADRAIDAVLNGREIGTVFESPRKPHEITPRKLWIALGDSVKGNLVIDKGAENALVNKGSSLLSVGISQVTGTFDAGDIIDVLCEGRIVARGMAEFSSDEVALACGRNSKQLAANRLLAPLAERPVIHRDDLIVF